MAPPRGKVQRAVAGLPGLSRFCDAEQSSWFDPWTARVVRIGYMAVSVLSQDPLPADLFHTFLARDRRALDGVFTLRREQVERIIARSSVLRERIQLAKRLLVRAFTQALAGAALSAREPATGRWAQSIVGRLRQLTAQSRALAREDITSADLSESLDERARGEWVQLDPGEGFSTYISFGQLAFHFMGTATLTPSAARTPETLQLDLGVVLSDTFDFHFLQEDEGTGWVDHALARLQCSGFAKPFRIEGAGGEFRLVIVGAVPP